MDIVETQKTIWLNKTEEKIFNFLKKVNKKYNLNVTFRVAGGWVRDKIMGLESDDIDIALDTMTGKELGKVLEKEKHIKIHIVQQNHEQCKHLEVAIVNLFDIKIEMVNLRSEEYGDSRIPTTQIGTPLEDALRRDLTINSMFYNINTGCIEDHTGKGLGDIKNKIIRTPLNPKQTFLDDPLRILRAVRFSVRLGFEIDEALIKVITNNIEIHDAFISKISQERILEEVKKMVKYSAKDSFQLLSDLGMFHAIFGCDYAQFNLHDADLFYRDMDQPHCLEPYLALFKYEKYSILDDIDAQKKYEDKLKKELTKMKITNKERDNIVLINRFVHHCTTSMIDSFLEHDSNHVRKIIHNSKLFVGRALIILKKKTLLNWALKVLQKICALRMKKLQQEFIQKKLELNRAIDRYCEKHTDMTSLHKDEVGEEYELSMDPFNVFQNKEEREKYKLEFANTCPNPNKMYKNVAKLVVELDWVFDMKPKLNGHEIMDLFKVKGKEIQTTKNLILDYQIMNKNCSKEDVIYAIKKGYQPRIVRFVFDEEPKEPKMEEVPDIPIELVYLRERVHGPGSKEYAKMQLPEISPPGK